MSLSYDKIEKDFDTLVTDRIKARKTGNKQLLDETEEEFSLRTKAYIKSVHLKHTKEGNNE